MREYPHGQKSIADVDTGPIVFGFAATPTVTTAGIARIAGDYPTYTKLLTLQELGSPIAKRLLIFDAFNIWSKTATNWVEPSVLKFESNFNLGLWLAQKQLLFALVSIVLPSGAFVIVYRRLNFIPAPKK